MKIKEIIGTSTFAWSPDVIPLLAVGSVAGAVDLNFSALSLFELWDPFGVDPHSPVFSVNLDDKFCALAWLRPFEGHRRGVVVGAMETGELKFWDADVLISSKSLQKALLHNSTKHSGAVKCLKFNPHQPHVLATGGQHGEIYIWDVRTFADPFAPGRAMTPMDEISSVSWNNAVSHILATTSNGGFTSIWDLKSKREVLHLSYNGPLGRADFSQVVWHPLQLTKLATASQSDGCPLIMTWDLRNASEPEKILEGHLKGVLSLDWCLQDPELLISSGKDNSTVLWNPIKGTKLGEYPLATNWTFLSKFAPSAPDVIATASFDGKIIVQTLQDTSPPISEQVKATDESDFWSNIATKETQKAEFEVKQAPSWLKTPSAVSFGFGSKLVVLRTQDGKSTISISKIATDSISNEFAEKLSAAAKSNDYSQVISAKLAEEGEKSDWEVLHQLAEHGKEKLFQDIVDGSDVNHNGAAIANGTEQKNDRLDDLDDLNDNSFFQNLANDLKSQKSLGIEPAYVPSGEFKILDGSQSATETSLAKLILSNKIDEAVTVCLQENKLTEALILSLDQDPSVKLKVKDHYFQKHHGDVLSRLIYSASSKDVLDIVSNADISNWKEIASSILAYNKDPADFSAKIVELGDRIYASGSSDKEYRDHALKCYLAGGALDKVSAIWLKELPDLEVELKSKHGDGLSSPFDVRWSSLGSFVEKLAAYRSISNITEPLSGPAIEPVLKAVFEFSNMTATGGHFELANQFLSLLPEDFPGLKAEKERIAAALGINQHKEVKNNYTRGKNNYAANGNKPRYANTRATPRAPPSISTTPNLRNALILSTTSSHRELPRISSPVPKARVPVSSNPYAPSAIGMGATAAPSAPLNPYSIGPQDPISNPLIHTNSLAPPVPMGPTGSVRPPSTPAIAALAPQPTQFGVSPLPAVVSPPPSKPSYKVETDGWNDLPDTFQAKKPARRAAAAPAVAPSASPIVTNAQANQLSKKPNVASPVLPPPPKLGSRVSLKSNVAAPPPATRSASSSNKYAPPPEMSPLQTPTVANGSLLHKHSGLTSSFTSGAPKNPYAPTSAPAGPPKVTYAPPPANTFAPPQPTSRSSSGTQASNPYAPNPNAAIAPPMRPTSRQLSTPPLARPPSRLIGSQSPSKPPMSAPGARNVQPPAQFAPPPRFRASSAANGPSTPPIGPPVSAPPKRTINAPATPPTGAAPGTPTIGAPPQSARSVAPPPSRPPRAARTASISSVVLHLGAGFPVSNGDRSQIPASAQPIFTTFTKHLEEIKPAAPPKYAKHVSDMEKRLNILFDHLNKQDVLSEGTLASLVNVASLLESKNYSAAASANNEIATLHAAEAGAWHTGVKRLITMAEAFDS